MEYSNTIVSQTNSGIILCIIIERRFYEFILLKVRFSIDRLNTNDETSVERDQSNH